MRGEFGEIYMKSKAPDPERTGTEQMIRASLMISKRQRILKARKVVASMAAKIIQKFVDPHTGICILQSTNWATIMKNLKFGQR